MSGEEGRTESSLSVSHWPSWTDNVDQTSILTTRVPFPLFSSSRPPANVCYSTLQMSTHSVHVDATGLGGACSVGGQAKGALRASCSVLRALCFLFVSISISFSQRGRGRRRGVLVYTY